MHLPAGDENRQLVVESVGLFVQGDDEKGPIRTQLTSKFHGLIVVQSPARVKSAKSNPGTTMQLTSVGSSSRDGPLPVSGWHNDLRLLAGGDVGSEHMSCRRADVATRLQKQRAAAVIQPQFGAAHRVPCRLLAGHQHEQDRRAGVPYTGVALRQDRLLKGQVAAPGLPEPAALRVGRGRAVSPILARRRRDGSAALIWSISV